MGSLLLLVWGFLLLLEELEDSHLQEISWHFEFRWIFLYGELKDWFATRLELHQFYKVSWIKRNRMSILGMCTGR
jgi:hypothetical protein